MTIEEKLRWCELALKLAAINFVLFYVGATIVGGSFDFEKSGAGHYFVREHEKHREVSFPFFIYSAIHTCSVIATSLIAIAACQFRNKHKPPK
ncbi:MAG TPA: hypothetical protein VM821_04105 [Abditibacteriaceae bacterium]|nr:hypothetical protein [Abditibacteriaceae bacterium]